MQRSSDLVRAGYKAQVQVQPNETLLFWIRGNDRFKLEFSEGRYRAKGQVEIDLTPQEMTNLLENDECELGPSALLRPLLQDSILPTIVTIGGPAEIAYFAQLDSIASFWDTETPILPRSGFTLVDRRAQRYLEKLDVTLLDVLKKSEVDLKEAVFRGLELSVPLETFDSLKKDVDKNLSRVRKQIRPIDPTLVPMLDKAGAKIDYHIDRVKNRLVFNREIRDSTVARQIAYLRNLIGSTGNLQERRINMAPLLESGGPVLLDRLVEYSQPFDWSHHILYL
jgi:uncharacterized protein YllA (UPF0747 family)